MTTRPLPLPAAALWCAVLTASTIVAGCASRSSRVETALIEAGVSARMAACLAPRLTDRLSDDQLRTLAKAARRAPGGTGKAGPAEIVARVTRTGDAQIIDVVSAAGLHCALRG
ncbi:hypothetical protein [Sphingomonas solaris]|uniref:Lipoprotein n=1 Tax=Alterirhizorhabdus solaris TaxID=2529389 RepID=A0A558R7N0_9SPHN|nr:hypothetical protein [Sphingomonas solaris]TVV75390.1 hypothetical protein FOY91_07345 [Sphingomonas solaris]